MSVKPRYVADTHALLWLDADPTKLGPEALEAFGAVASGLADLLVPTISVVEVQYKEDKHHFAAGTTARLVTFAHSPGVAFAPLDESVALACAKVPRASVPDMPDRIIAATALATGASLITVDEKISAWAGVPIVW